MCNVQDPRVELMCVGERGRCAAPFFSCVFHKPSLDSNNPSLHPSPSLRNTAETMFRVLVYRHVPRVAAAAGGNGGPLVIARAGFTSSSSSLFSLSPSSSLLVRAPPRVPSASALRFLARHVSTTAYSLQQSASAGSASAGTSSKSSGEARNGGETRSGGPSGGEGKQGAQQEDAQGDGAEEVYEPEPMVARVSRSECSTWWMTG